MNLPEQAKIILEVFDTYAPTNINWNLEKMWIDAIIKGLEAVKKEETKDEV